jgi:hypothetical protein
MALTVPLTRYKNMVLAIAEGRNAQHEPSSQDNSALIILPCMAWSNSLSCNSYSHQRTIINMVPEIQALKSNITKIGSSNCFILAMISLSRQPRFKAGWCSQQFAFLEQAVMSKCTSNQIAQCGWKSDSIFTRRRQLLARVPIIMAVGIIERLQGYASSPVFGSRNWEQLYSPSTFEWQHGSTPGSHVVVVLALLVGYVAFSFLIQAIMSSRKRVGRYRTPDSTLKNQWLGIAFPSSLAMLTSCARCVEGPFFTSLVVLHNNILSYGSLAMVRKAGHC